MYKCIISFNFEGKLFWKDGTYMDVELNGLTNKHIQMNFIKLPHLSTTNSDSISEETRNIVQEMWNTPINDVPQSPIPVTDHNSHDYGGGDFGGGGAGSSWDSSDSSSDSGGSDD
jgi:hypothetical protein